MTVHLFSEHNSLIKTNTRLLHSLVLHWVCRLVTFSYAHFWRMIEARLGCNPCRHQQLRQGLDQDDCCDLNQEVLRHCHLHRGCHETTGVEEIKMRTSSLRSGSTLQTTSNQAKDLTSGLHPGVLRRWIIDRNFFRRFQEDHSLGRYLVTALLWTLSPRSTESDKTFVKRPSTSIPSWARKKKQGTSKGES